MKKQLYSIEAITNLHVGNGEINVGVIDNRIQRDFISEHPTILASSLKGALREHFRTKVEKDEVNKIFGTDIVDIKNDSENKSSTPGSFKFFDAHLLSIPFSDGKGGYINITCTGIILNFLKYAELFNLRLSEKLKISLNDIKDINFSVGGIPINNDSTDPKIKKITGKYTDTIKELFGNSKLIVVKDKDFTILCDDEHLPVVARNNLMNPNLWYEQILPRFSRFYFILMRDEPETNLPDVFSCKISEELVQIGANASIGCGYCSVNIINCPEQAKTEIEPQKDKS
jgi:CRISPR-associated protein Cmr4